MEETVYFYDRRFLDDEPDTNSTEAILAKVSRYVNRYAGGEHHYYDGEITFISDDGKQIIFSFDIDGYAENYNRAITKLTLMRNTIQGMIEGMVEARSDYNKERDSPAP